MLNWLKATRKRMNAGELKERRLEQFKKLHESKPDDNVAAYYIKITENFFIKGKYPTEQDDVGVAYNVEDGVFKLLQK